MALSHNRLEKRFEHLKNKIQKEERKIVVVYLEIKRQREKKIHIFFLLEKLIHIGTINEREEIQDFISLQMDLNGGNKN